MSTPRCARYAFDIDGYRTNHELSAEEHVSAILQQLVDAISADDACRVESLCAFLVEAQTGDLEQYGIDDATADDVAQLVRVTVAMQPLVDHNNKRTTLTALLLDCVAADSLLAVLESVYSDSQQRLRLVVLAAHTQNIELTTRLLQQCTRDPAQYFASYICAFELHERLRAGTYIGYGAVLATLMYSVSEDTLLDIFSCRETLTSILAFITDLADATEDKFQQMLYTLLRESRRSALVLPLVLAKCRSSKLPERSSAIVQRLEDMLATVSVDFSQHFASTAISRLPIEILQDSNVSLTSLLAESSVTQRIASAKL